MPVPDPAAERARGELACEQSRSSKRVWLLRLDLACLIKLSTVQNEQVQTHLSAPSARARLMTSRCPPNARRLPRVGPSPPPPDNATEPYLTASQSAATACSRSVAPTWSTWRVFAFLTRHRSPLDGADG